MSQQLEQRVHGKHLHLKDLLNEAGEEKKSESQFRILKRLCSCAFPIYDITGCEHEALIILINIAAGEQEKILYKSVAKKNLKDKAFQKKSLSSLAGALTHNGKLFDSTLRSRLLVLPEYDPDNVRVHSGSIAQGRDIGYAYNSNLVRVQKWILTPFIYRNKRICLAQVLGGKSNKLMAILKDLGLDEAFAEEIKAGFEKTANRRPKQIDGSQIIVQDEKGNDLALSPLCSHLIHCELQNRLREDPFYKLANTVNVGSPVNAGGYGNLVSDSGGQLKLLSVRRSRYLSLLERFYHQVNNDLPVFNAIEVHQLDDIEYETYEHNNSEQESEYLNIGHLTKIRRKVSRLVYSLLKPVLKVKSRVGSHAQWLKHYQVLLAEQLIAKPADSVTIKLKVAWLSVALGHKRVTKVRNALLENTFCKDFDIKDKAKFSNVVEKDLVILNPEQLINISASAVLAYVMNQLDSSLPANIKQYIRNDVKRELSRLLKNE
ncbi:hypothetical protein [Endozoicomonas euniceicola]|uniref:Uncharacterized protein n=1 Tax=Endozoicomonas euniceicola TaxID=1234143 RepID=A0ABY6GUB5_9GAMM|nr:hypothetical protein [Endozoicomonas euniceicola]UYM16290.1 hypothetical protein NX720_26430 [Endozoicomonas euniceicola]